MALFVQSARLYEFRRKSSNIFESIRDTIVLQDVRPLIRLASTAFCLSTMNFSFRSSLVDAI
jgi:hypothetical protein